MSERRETRYNGDRTGSKLDCYYYDSTVKLRAFSNFCRRFFANKAFLHHLAERRHGNA